MEHGPGARTDRPGLYRHRTRPSGRGIARPVEALVPVGDPQRPRASREQLAVPVVVVLPRRLLRVADRRHHRKRVARRRQQRIPRHQGPFGAVVGTVQDRRYRPRPGASPDVDQGARQCRTRLHGRRACQLEAVLPHYHGVRARSAQHLEPVRLRRAVLGRHGHRHRGHRARRQRQQRALSPTRHVDPVHGQAGARIPRRRRHRHTHIAVGHGHPGLRIRRRRKAPLRAHPVRRRERDLLQPCVHASGVALRHDHRLPRQEQRPRSAPSARRKRHVERLLALVAVVVHDIDMDLTRALRRGYAGPVETRPAHQRRADPDHAALDVGGRVRRRQLHVQWRPADQRPGGVAAQMQDPHNGPCGLGVARVRQRADDPAALHRRARTIEVETLHGVGRRCAGQRPHGG